MHHVASLSRWPAALFPALVSLLTIVLLLGCASKAEPLGPQPGAGSFAFSQDIGDVGTPGSLRYSADRGYEIAASGIDIWGARDNFHFAYVEATGDATLQAQVDLGDATGEWFRKALLMFRVDTRLDSPHISAVIHENGLAALQYRPTPGAPTLELHASVTDPKILRVTRSEDRFTASFSVDGDTWDHVGPLQVELPRTALLGIATSAHHENRLARAYFSEVALETTDSD